MNEKLTDARQMLAACGWTISTCTDNTGKALHVVVDNMGLPRRSFVPIERLYDYARGVFDAQRF
jgi:hypothetical protein